MATKKGSLITIKFNPQSNDFLVGLNYDNPDQFVRIPISVLPKLNIYQGNNLLASNILDIKIGNGINSSYDTNTRIVTLSVDGGGGGGGGGSNAKTIHRETLSEDLYLESTSDYFQIIDANGFTITLPTSLTDNVWETEIINNGSTQILLFTGSSSLYINQWVYVFWDGFSFRVTERSLL